MENKKLDLGNNEMISQGLFAETDGTFTALTFSRSKNFKTEVGAIRWLSKRNLNKFGNRIN
jgi:hypothetical protein